ncbi:hypothetical protein VN12_23415 [Pirellula sp. SH-Sr6A]|uniref:hypothetical protein n=1 Tax=Pirellula sp. SH-Sr6A TaxID=1632865 RepID=UPI00078E4270|nr:hypothetical protein [Pirellula sp. SH-Sr6A]AMV35095.1 hypothetical protein VN12_23415 [Pirellula sp. SH-Sr6A]
MNGGNGKADSERFLHPLPVKLFFALGVEYLCAVVFSSLLLSDVYEGVLESLSSAVVASLFYLPAILMTWKCRQVPVSISSENISGPSIISLTKVPQRQSILISSIDSQRTDITDRWWKVGSFNRYRVVDSQGNEIVILRHLYSKADVELVLRRLKAGAPSIQEAVR